MTSWILHSLRRHVGLISTGDVLGAELDLLVLLDQTAAGAAVRAAEITERRTLDAEPVTHHASLVSLHQALAANGRKQAPDGALVIGSGQLGTLTFIKYIM